MVAARKESTIVPRKNIPDSRLYTKHPFSTPDNPQLCGAWFYPQTLRHQLVLVGLAGTAHQIACYEQNPLWLETVMAAGFRVLLLDYRGHGESALAPEQSIRQVRFKDLVEDVWHVLHAAGLTPPQTLLYGHSLGAGVALEVAAELAEDLQPFAGVVALGGVAGSRWRGMYLRGMPGNFARYPKTCWRAMKNPQEFFLHPSLARKLLFQSSTPEATVEAAIQLTGPESGRALTDLCFSLRTRPLRAKRVLFVSGANDGCVPTKVVCQSVADYQALGQQVDLVVLSGTPHNLFADGRVREAAQTLVQFAQACEEGQ